MSKFYDVIVVGSGIAGLSFALKVSEAGYHVAIITKKNSAESNTNYAQGGIAAVTSQTDDVEMHVADTLDAGDGLCDEEAVREILKDGSASIDELIKRGVDFSQLDDGRVSLGKEGGHSKRRILHVRDITGKAIEQALVNSIEISEKIDTLEHYFAVELITSKKIVKKGQNLPETNRVLGLYALDTQRVLYWLLQAVLVKFTNTPLILSSRLATESRWPIARESKCRIWNLFNSIRLPFIQKIPRIDFSYLKQFEGRVLSCAILMARHSCVNTTSVKTSLHVT